MTQREARVGAQRRSILLVLGLMIAGCGADEQGAANGMSESRFEFYQCMVDDEFASIRVDVALHDAAPDASRPHSLRVRVPFLKPTEEGMPTREEAEQTWTLEEALKSALAEATLAGVLTSAGARSWYFFTDDPDRDVERAEAACREVLPEHTPKIGSFEDPEWLVYLDFLYPNELAWNYIQDHRVLSAMEEHGDDGTTPRPITFWASFPQAEARVRFRKAIEALGYNVEEIYEDAETEAPHWIRFTTAEPLAPQDIFPVSERLLITATECGGTLDGWEAEALSPEASSGEER